jgi:ethanolamine utilization protein EutN
MSKEQLSLIVRTVLEVLNVLQSGGTEWDNQENVSIGSSGIKGNENRNVAPHSLPDVRQTDDRSGEEHMIQAKVIGSVWSSHKIDELTGHKLMLVRAKEGQEHSIVAIDRVGAGLGDTVLISFSKTGPIDAQIVAIVDPAESR